MYVLERLSPCSQTFLSFSQVALVTQCTKNRKKRISQGKQAKIFFVKSLYKVHFDVANVIRKKISNPKICTFYEFSPVFNVKRGAEAPWRPILWRWKRPSSCYSYTVRIKSPRKQVSGKMVIWPPICQYGLVSGHFNRLPNCSVTCPNWTFLRTLPWTKGPNRIGCQPKPIRTPYGMNKLSPDSLKLVKKIFKKFNIPKL